MKRSQLCYNENDSQLKLGLQARRGGGDLIAREQKTALKHHGCMTGFLTATQCCFVSGLLAEALRARLQIMDRSAHKKQSICSLNGASQPITCRGLSMPGGLPATSCLSPGMSHPHAAMRQASFGFAHSTFWKRHLHANGVMGVPCKGDATP